MRFEIQSFYLNAQPAWLRYGLALLLVAAAATATVYIPPIGERSALLLFSFAIIQASFWLGFKPGILAAVLSLIAVNALVLMPHNIETHELFILNTGFFLVSAAMVLTTGFHRQLAKALWESRQNLAYAQTIGQIGSWRLNVHRNELSWSDENHRIFGIPKGRPMSYETFLATVHPDDRDYVDSMWQAGLRGEPYDIEHRLIVAGKEKWVRERAVLKFGKNGNLLGGFGTTQDITQRKLAEQALRDQKKQLRLIMDATPALISYLDTDFRYLRVNANYEKWLGITADYAVGRKVVDVLGEPAWTIIQPYLERAVAGEKVNFDTKIPRKDGNLRWVHASYIPDLDSSAIVKGIVVHVTDITERKQAEQQIASLNQNLQRRIEEMQVVFDTVPIGLSIAEDAKASHIHGNPAIEQMFGLPDGSNLSMRSSPMAAVGIMQSGLPLEIKELPMQRAVRGAIVANQVIDIFRPDGLQLTLLCNASPLFDEDGKPRGAVGAFLDITALRQAERALEKNQLQLRLLVEQAPLSIAMFDRDMNYLVTSRRWIDDFGRGHDELIGLNHYDVHPDIPDVWKQVHRKAQAGEFLRNDDDLWIQADGSRHWLRWAAYPWTNLSGEIAGIIISCENMTAHRKAEQELHSSEARLALIVEQVKAGYWDWDLIARKLFLSPQLKRQIGFDDSELANRRDEWEQRLHPDDKAFVCEAVDSCIDGHRPRYELEFRLRHKDGSYRWIHALGVQLCDQHNQPYRILGINLDITDYIKQKDLRERRDKMEQSFQMSVVGQTAAAIAHELNQPLAAISSYADVALYILQSGEANPEKLCHLIENCSKQAQRAGEVIRQLLNQLQKGEAVIESIDINAVIYEAIDLVKAEGLLDDDKLDLDLAAGLPPVKANALQIQKILINLLHNALEAMPEQGVNAEKIRVISCLSAADGAGIKVTVRDSGKGVADNAALKKIFQPFYTTKPAGLGMGLTISRSLIGAHGGKMWAERNAGSGIALHFTLPSKT